MLYIQSPNPCLCTPSIVNPTCPEDCTCLQVCNIVVNALSDTAVGPCGATGNLDISDTDIYAHDFCACGTDTVYWSIVSYDKKIFAAASITKQGVLTWITMDEDSVASATPPRYGCIIVKACCGNLSALATVQIGVKDLCNPCPGCENCEDCDSCTGNCIDTGVNISVIGINSQSNTTLSGS